MSAPYALPFPRDPAYGNRVVRRRFRLINHAGRVEAHLSDEFHEMHCTLWHAGGIITDIDARAFRIPTTACPGAAVVLRELIGLPLAMPREELYEKARVRRNCTHMFDLAALAIAQAARPHEAGRVYDAAVPDETDAPVTVIVECDGQVIHRWLVRDHHIVEPEALAGRPLLRGFTRWAAETFEGDALEAAIVLERTCLIAQGGPYLSEAFTGRTLRLNAVMAGVCHGYAEATLDSSWFIAGARRDFTAGVVEQPVNFFTEDHVEAWTEGVTCRSDTGSQALSGDR
ncbi:DUF2889 domain-containing protein [Rhizorhabdus dicambivorans]|uniref:DUF2889 domain-containing protein n=1 Tax=Rhizorhabdus dicambivorans TaxID=1850238 RepID=UPI0008363B53|nr:DUF2889 domain-containing protein [Rhizorhabdus dicambivorans]